MSAHTPGIWRWQRAETRHSLTATQPDGRAIPVLTARTAHAGKVCPPSRANERLIESAPELLRALKDLRDACTDAYKAGRISAEPFVRAGNVIASALGKAVQR